MPDRARLSTQTPKPSGARGAVPGQRRSTNDPQDARRWNELQHKVGNAAVTRALSRPPSPGVNATGVSGSLAVSRADAPETITFEDDVVVAPNVRDRAVIDALSSEVETELTKRRQTQLNDLNAAVAKYRVYANSLFATIPEPANDEALADLGAKIGAGLVALLLPEGAALALVAAVIVEATTEVALLTAFESALKQAAPARGQDVVDAAIEFQVSNFTNRTRALTAVLPQLLLRVWDEQMADRRLFTPRDHKNVGLLCDRLGVTKDQDIYLKTLDELAPPLAEWVASQKYRKELAMQTYEHDIAESQIRDARAAGKQMAVVESRRRELVEQGLEAEYTRRVER
jgi:hypothetical protein